MSLPAQTATEVYDEAFRAGLRPDPLLTISEWADRYRRLSGKAAAEPGPWRTDRTPYLREIMDNLSPSSVVERVVFMKGSQVGGPLALDTPVPTVQGWTTMGAIRAGETVFDESGQPCRVTGISEIFIGRDCYEITFPDGSTIVSDGVHRWVVWDDLGADKRKLFTTTTAAMYPRHKAGPRRDRNRFAIDVAGPLCLPTADMALDPYLLGSNLRIVKNKRIPPCYLRASFTQRLALLQGLMDSDGRITENGHCEFSTAVPALRDGCFELLMTLGLKATVYSSAARDHQIDGRHVHLKKSWKISFQVYDDLAVFRLCRQRAGPVSREGRRPTEAERRRIVDIRLVPSVPVRCIAVDSPSHLFLAGRSMIPTHNTECGNNWIGYMIHKSPGPMMVVQPTVEMAKRNSKQRIELPNFRTTARAFSNPRMSLKDVELAGTE